MDIPDNGHHDAQDASKTLAGAKAVGHEQLNVNGTMIDLSDPSAGAKFALIKAKAIADGNYEGKGLKFGEGGRAKMFYDQLRIDGKTDAQANDIVKINFLNKMQADGKTPIK
jgi:hypothetical protein